MVTTRKQALEIAGKARRALAEIYGARLQAVYLYGSGARDQLTPESDIDIAVILDSIPNRFAEHERTSQLGADLSLEYDTVVLFFFAAAADLKAGRFGIHRAIKEEGIAA
jgi:predicted nucleotidyltransferase